MTLGARVLFAASAAAAVLAAGCHLEQPASKSAEPPGVATAAAAALAVGKPCPPFTFETSDGGKFSLADAKGKDLIVFVGSYT